MKQQAERLLWAHIAHFRRYLPLRNALTSYLQGHDADVMTAKVTCHTAMETLAKCRNEDTFSLIFEKKKKLAEASVKLPQH